MKDNIRDEGYITIMGRYLQSAEINMSQVFLCGTDCEVLT